ncbi:MAG: hypothetical protein AAGI07_10245 [Bacteroidota bacterium]
MAQYIPFGDGVEVNGQSVLAFVNALPAYNTILREILSKYEIPEIKKDEWYSQKKILNAYEEVGKTYGANTLFALGKAIPEYATFPPELDNLEKALSSIGMAYDMNHRNGEIGYPTFPTPYSMW